MDFGHRPYLYPVKQETENREDGWALRLHEHPEILFVAQRAEQLAHDILEQKSRLLKGAPEGAGTVERPTDAIGNHRRVLELRAQGADPDIVAGAEQEAYFDSMYGFGEKMQKLDSDLPEARWLDVDEHTGTIFAGNVPLHENYEKALTPLTTPVETARRTKEFCNVAVMEQVQRLRLDKDNNYAFISLIPDDKDTIKKSYVPEIKKMMVNFISFHDTGEGKKMRLQIGAIPGTEIDLNDINRLLGDMGQIEPGEKLDETEVLGLPIPLPKTGFTDVVDVIELLDDHDEQELFMGWKVPEGHSKDYRGEHGRCAQKYKKFAGKVQIINDYAYSLARQGVRPEESEELIGAKQKELAIQVCQADPSQARITFNDAAEKSFQEITDLRSAGKAEQADENQAELIESLPDLEGCGGGACDLYRDAKDEEVTSAQKLGLTVGVNERVKHNGYARCGKCGRKGLLQVGIGFRARFACPNCRRSNTNSRKTEQKRKQDKQKKLKKSALQKKKSKKANKNPRSPERNLRSKDQRALKERLPKGIRG